MVKLTINQNVIKKPNGESSKKIPNQFNFIYKKQNNGSQLLKYGSSFTQLKILTNPFQFNIDEGVNLKDIWFSFDNDNNYKEEDLDKIINCFEFSINGQRFNKYPWEYLKLWNNLHKQCIFIKKNSILIHIEFKRLSLSKTVVDCRFLPRFKIGYSLSSLKNLKCYVLYEEFRKPLNLNYQEYFNQIQFTGSEVFNGNNVRVRSGLNHTSSLLMFYATDQNNNPLKNFIKHIVLKFNGREYISYNKMDMKIAMKDYGISNFNNEIYYAIPLNSLIHSMNWTGSINLSRIDNITIDFTFKESKQGYIYLFCKNINILREYNNIVSVMYFS